MYKLKKNDLIKISLLCLFTLFELVSIKSNTDVQIIITIIEYSFLGIYILFDFHTGLFYFVSFTILALGQENFLDTELPLSYWGLRIGPFSLNLLFTFIVLIYGIIKDNIIFSNSFRSLFFRIYFLLIIYSSLIGIFFMIIGVNYLDNYLADFFSFGILLIYYLLLNTFDCEKLNEVFKFTIISTLFGLFIFYLTDSKYSYGQGGDFLFSNSYWFILPIVFFFTKNIFKPMYNNFFLSLIFVLVSSKLLFVGGKHIILFLLISLLLLFRKNKLILILTLFLFINYLDTLFLWLIDFFSGNVISYKFSQIYFSLEELNFNSIADNNSSIGNIFAEAKTIYVYFINNPIFFLFGMGFGSGIPDLFGYLAPGAGNSAYAGIDLLRNNYHKMHLPIFEIILKTGFLGMFIYVSACWFYLKKGHKYWLFVFLFFFVFYVTKELMLLTVFFLLYAEKQHSSTDYIGLKK
jgi:hypothetical protein